jgi:hypothetical protein
MIIVISGPNAKTIRWKLLDYYLQLMLNLNAGFPFTNAVKPFVWQNPLTDIGDNQSIEIIWVPKVTIEEYELLEEMQQENNVPNMNLAVPTLVCGAFGRNFEEFTIAADITSHIILT